MFFNLFKVEISWGISPLKLEVKKEIVKWVISTFKMNFKFPMSSLITKGLTEMSISRISRFFIIGVDKGVDLHCFGMDELIAWYYLGMDKGLEIDS